MKYPQSHEQMVYTLHLSHNMKKCLNAFEHELLNKQIDLGGEAESLNELRTLYKSLEEALK